MSYEVFERFIDKVRESKVITKGNFKLVAKYNTVIYVYYNSTLIGKITHEYVGEVFIHIHSDYNEYKHYKTLSEMLEGILKEHNEMIETQATRKKKIEKEYIDFMYK